MNSILTMVLLLMVISWGFGLCSYPIFKVAYVELVKALDEAEQKEKDLSH